MAFGVTEDGFVLKRLADIKASLVDNLSNVTDSDSGESLTPDLSDENDPLVNEINAISDAMVELWEVAQASYNQFDPLRSTGVGLTSLVQLNNLRRRKGTESIVVVTITGTPFLFVNADKKISKVDDTAIFVLPAFTIGVGGTVSVEAEADEVGETEALVGTIVKIVTPVSGWTAVTNLLDATVGTDEETDSDLFSRQQESTANTGRSTIEDMYSALAALENVITVKVYQNNNLSTDYVTGIPGKSVAVVIQGGDNDEISEQIFIHGAMGVFFFGTTVTSQIDLQGISYGTNFTRPDEIPIYVYAEIIKVNPELWPDDGEDLIKSYIIAYATGGAGDIDIDEGFDREGFLPGEDVIASELYTPINKQPGLRIVLVKIGLALIPDEDELSISWNEISSWDAARIDLNILEDT